MGYGSLIYLAMVSLSPSIRSHFIVHVKLSRNIVHVCTVSYMVICRLVIVSNVHLVRKVSY